MSDPQQNINENQILDTTLELTVEEIFLMELLSMQNIETLNIIYTNKGIKIKDNELLSKYYSKKEIIQLIESLVFKEKIEKNEKGSVLLCPRCGEHTSKTILMCPKCGSTRVEKNENIYHPECDNSFSREECTGELKLTCPHCNELLDPKASEGTPGFYKVTTSRLVCEECGTNVIKNNPLYICSKCNQVYSANEASYINSISYTVPSTYEFKTNIKPIEKKPKKQIKPIKKKIKLNETPKEIPETTVDKADSNNTFM